MSVETGKSGVIIVQPRKGEGNGAEPADVTANLDELVVTGSRIAHIGYDQPTTR